MTEQTIPLALAFLKAQPQAAAHILEQHAPSDVAEFIKNTPTEHCTEVFKYMLPSYVAKLSKALSTEEFTSVIAPLEIKKIAMVTRHLDTNKRTQVLAKLPTKTAASCKLLFKFSQNSVGAWMTTRVATTTPEPTLAQTINTLKQHEDMTATGCIFVVDRSGHYQGRLDYLDLLGNSSENPVSKYIKPEKSTLSAHMSLDKANQHAIWKCHEIAPVVDYDKNFIGVLEHRGLREALAHTQNQIPENKREESLMGINQLYGNTLLSLFKTMAGIAKSDIQQNREA